MNREDQIKMWEQAAMYGSELRGNSQTPPTSPGLPRIPKPSTPAELLGGSYRANPSTGIHPESPLGKDILSGTGIGSRNPPIPKRRP
jgi:hypothetical protein